MKLQDKKLAELYRKLGDLDVMTFDPQKVQKTIMKSYAMKEKAHELLLQADLLLDEVFTKIYGEIKIDKRGKN